MSCRTRMWPRARRAGYAGALALVVVGTLGAANAQAATVDLFAAPTATGAGDCSSAADACTVLDAVASANAQATTDSVRISLADGAPADNGGPTQTVALRNTPVPATALANPAFNVVPPSFALPAAIDGQTGACATADQRGVLPAVGANCAIGAYLLQTPIVTLAPSSPVVAPGSPVTWIATFAPAGTTGGTVAFDDGAGGAATTQCPAQPLTGGTATCTVTYPTIGIRTASAAYTGDGAQNNFGPSASGPATVAVGVLLPPTPPTPPTPPSPPSEPTPPSQAPSSLPAALTLSGVALRPRCVPPTASSARLSYALDRAAKVTFTVQKRRTPPRAPRARCRTPRRTTSTATYVLPGASAGRSPYATVHQVRRSAGGRKRVALTRTLAATAGRHRASLARTLRATGPLRPGRYRLLVSAVASDGTRSAIAVVPFWVLKAAPRR